jgi:hypothetical protein
MLLISYYWEGSVSIVVCFQYADDTDTDTETNSSKSLRQLREGVESKVRIMISSLPYVLEEGLRMVGSGCRTL